MSFQPSVILLIVIQAIVKWRSFNMTVISMSVVLLIIA
jgi:hypothetical protein